MTGDRSFFKMFEPKKGGNVTFGDESKSQIKGKGIISLLGLSDITNVLYVEGVDFDETFAPMAHIESMVLLALACHLKFKLYQMDVKSTFLNGFLKEEVYVSQPKGFVDPYYPNHVLYLKKTLYGLKQAPRAWYDRLIEYLMANRFSRGQVNRILFIKKVDGELVVAQVYVDEIIFRSTKDDLEHSFSSMMQTEFEMSMIGELNLDFKFGKKTQVPSSLNLNMQIIL